MFYKNREAKLSEQAIATSPAVRVKKLYHLKISKRHILAGLILLAGAAGIGFAGGWVATKTTPIQKQQVIMKSQGELISQIAKKLSPSVVSVETVAVGQSASLFDSTTLSQEEGAGTGFVLSADGLIITNRHVVPANTTSVSVTLSDGTKYKDVEIVGRTGAQDSLDIAFLRIKDTKGKKLQPVTIGDSSKLQLGESVIAIGNALGQFRNTVTAGIVSGFGRNIQAGDESGTVTESLENLLQTDAAINQGNSGGPLVNIYGEVVGINTAIVSGEAQNIGFAMPINDVKGLIDGVLKTGKLQRPYIGIFYVPITDSLAEQYGFSVKRGAYVPSSELAGQDTIVNGSPAAKAGIRSGDIITKVNGIAVDESNSFTALLGRHKAGDKVTLIVVRDKNTITIDVTLQAAPTN